MIIELGDFSKEYGPTGWSKYFYNWVYTYKIPVSFEYNELYCSNSTFIRTSDKEVKGYLFYLNEYSLNLQQEYNCSFFVYRNFINGYPKYGIDITHSTNAALLKLMIA